MANSYLRDLPPWPLGTPLTPGGLFLFYDPDTDEEYSLLPEQVGGTGEGGLTPNLAANNLKEARYLTNNDRGSDTGVTAEEILARHADYPVNLGALFLVEFPTAQLYILVYDDGTNTTVPAELRRIMFRTGDQVPGDTVPGMLVPFGSPEQSAANIPVLDPTRNYPVDFTVKQPYAGEIYYFGSVAGGVHPAPATEAGDANWRRESAPAASGDSFEAITRTQGIALLDARQVRRHRLYLVTIGIQRVFVTGMDDATFSGPGQLIDPNNSERTISVTVDVRAGTIINNQAQLEAVGSLFYSPSTSGSAFLAGYNSFQAAINTIKSTTLFLVFNGSTLPIHVFAAGTTISGYITLYGRRHQVRVSSGDTLTIGGSISLRDIGLRVDGATNGWPIDVRGGYLQGTFTAKAAGSSLQAFDTDLSLATLLGTGSSTLTLRGSTVYSDAQIVAARALGIVVIDLRPNPLGVAQRTGSVLQFDLHAEYSPLFAGTFSFDTASQIVGATVRAYLGPACTAPAMPSDFQLVSGAYAAGVSLMYSFCVGANGKIQYYINQLP